MSRPGTQVCPFHPDESVRPERLATETADFRYVCGRRGHPGGGPFQWTFVSTPPPVAGDPLDLGLRQELPEAVAAAVSEAGSSWVEYGLVERAYARQHPTEWAVLLGRYDHTHFHEVTRVTRAELPYTASKYLARSLGTLSRDGTLAHIIGRGTGRWSYNTTISYFAAFGTPTDADAMTWEASGASMSDYMPRTRPTG